MHFAGVTSEIQLIDDGVGYAVKNEMGHALDRWLEEDNNLQRWTAAPGAGDGQALAMWEKRVLVTHLVAAAWEKVCATFDFEKAATRLGMRMTINGEGDELIKIQGVENYSFCEADGGLRIASCVCSHLADALIDIVGCIAGDQSNDPINLPQGADPEENGLLDQEVEELVVGEEDGPGGDEEVEVDQDDEIDDTSDPLDVGAAPSTAPPGFRYANSPPPLETDEDKVKLVGRFILHAFSNATFRGWYI